MISNHNRHHSPCPCIGFAYHAPLCSSADEFSRTCMHQCICHCGSSEYILCIHRCKHACECIRNPTNEYDLFLHRAVRNTYLAPIDNQCRIADGANNHFVCFIEFDTQGASNNYLNSLIRIDYLWRQEPPSRIMP